MIIQQNNNETNAVVIGEIKENQVGIDTSNLNYLTSLLTTNLYSNPKGSFIRETISNAWDSHKEAGVDTPIILEFGKEGDNNLYIRIKDSGVGISPERFDKIYKNLGSSTKRDSNEQIGGFGIGRFSALAVSSMVSLSNVYNGKCYKYTMYKDGDAIHIDELAAYRIDEHNGLEVKVYIHEDEFLSYVENLKQITYFDSVYINTVNIDDDYKFSEGVCHIKKFNTRVFKKYNNFYVTDRALASVYYRYAVTTRVRALLGNVLYEINESELRNICSGEILEFCDKCCIDLTFNIGELDITPNREQLLYSNKTKNALKSKLEAAYAEVSELIKQEYFANGTDFQDIFTYTYMNSKSELHIKNEGVSNIVFNIADSYHSLCTYKGYKLPKEILNSFYNNCKYKIYWEKLAKTLYYGGTFYNKRLNYRMPYEVIKVLYTGKLMLAYCKGPLNKKLRYYISKDSKFTNNYVLILNNNIRNRFEVLNEFITTLSSRYSYSTCSNVIYPIFKTNPEILTYIKSDIIKYFKDNCIELSEDTIPDNILESYKSLYSKPTSQNIASNTKKVTVKLDNDSINIKKYRFASNDYYGEDFLHKVTGDSKLLNLNSLKEVIIYGSHEESKFVKFAYLVGSTLKNHMFVTMSNFNVKKVRSLPKFIHVLDFLDIDKSKNFRNILEKFTRQHFIRCNEIEVYDERINHLKYYSKYIKDNYHNYPMYYNVKDALYRTSLSEEVRKAWIESPYYKNIQEELNNPKMLAVSKLLKCVPIRSACSSRAIAYTFILTHKLDFINPKEYHNYKYLVNETVTLK